MTDYTATYPLTGGGGAAPEYVGTSPTTVTVGGLPAGSAISGETLSMVLQQILVPYINPSFSSFSMSGQATAVEVGTTLSGSKSFTFGFNTIANVIANTMTIYDVTANVALATGLPLTSPQSATIATVTNTSPSSYSWCGVATATSTNTFYSGNFTVNWLYRMYWGDSTTANLAASDILALSSNSLTSGFAGTYSFAAGGYKFFSWPDSFGSPTATTGFKDTSNGLPMAMAPADSYFTNTQNGWSYALVSVTNSLSVTTNYRVYRTQNVLGGAYTIAVS